MTERNSGLDLLKIIACFAVVVLHVTGMVPVAASGYSIHNTLYYIAGLAVPVFFMVNGCLLLGKTELTYRYVSKKIANILAIVLAWNVLIYLIRLILEHKATNPYYAALANLVQGDYYWQFWFFGALIVIYLALPVIHRAFKNTKAAVVMTGIFAALCISADIANTVRSAAGLPIIEAYVPQTFRLWTWLAYFLLGGLLGKKQIRDAVTKRLRPAANWAVFLGAVIVISVYQYKMSFFYRDGRAEIFYDNIFTFVYIASLFILVCRHSFTEAGSRVTGRLSKNVMGVYIIHVSVLTLMTLYYQFNAQLTNMCLIFIVFLLSLAASAVIGRIPLARKLISI
jgi:surface polysaccharide O-acyltransferase-like enzyme